MISASHVDGRGSIPRFGVLFLDSFPNKIPFLHHTEYFFCLFKRMFLVSGQFDEITFKFKLMCIGIWKGRLEEEELSVIVDRGGLMKRRILFVLSGD
jgi:hypothetical protein